MRLTIGVVLAAALAFPGAASAGCWATVGLAPPPKGTAPGEVWVARVTVLQHGRHPLPDAKTARPTVTIRNAATGEKATFPASPTDRLGVYRARVVFPSRGTWTYEVFDGFTTADGQKVPCARTHTFAPVTITGSPSVGGTDRTAAAEPGTAPSDSFPVWPLVGAVALALAVAGAALALGYRPGIRSSRPA